MPIGVGAGIAIAAGLSAGGAVVQSRAAGSAAQRQAQAANNAAILQTNAANKATEGATASNEAVIKFQREAEAERKAEWEKTQALNLEQFNADLARRQPYMNMGLGALAQMSRPMPQRAPRPQAGASPTAPYQPLYSRTPTPPGSLGDLIAKQGGA